MFIADLHIHSAYAYATSRDLLPPQLDASARTKGVQLLATADFTHPGYRKLLQEQLAPAEEGLFKLKPELQLPLKGALAAAQETRFVICGEISSIYKKNGRTRKVHNLVLLPDFAAAEKFSVRLEALGCNLRSDGRPIIGLSSRDLLEITLESSAEAIFIPAHIWTPHFSLFGAYSGYDTIEECFEDLTPHIHALETGLSSDPTMIWQLSCLDEYALVSNSDAHSPAKLAREANIFNCELSYPQIKQALETPHHPDFCGTIEFFPEEGKYHYDGHRNCHVCTSPEQTAALSGICPVCGKQLTLGVAQRVAQLADRPIGFRPEQARPFENLVPLAEIIAPCLGVRTSSSIKVQREYNHLLETLGSELHILRHAELAEIEQTSGPVLAEAIRRVRAGEVQPRPGYDGEYGRIEVIDQETIDRLTGQARLFPGLEAANNTTLSGSTMQPAAAKKSISKSKQAAQAAEGRALLNAEQEQAATSSSAAIAVSAGPGTGKTKTLVARISHLLQNQQADPSSIVAVTFTNKAAEEMRQRLSAVLPEKKQAKQLKIGTFHSICMQLIAEQGQNSFLLSPADCADIAAEVKAELQLSASASSLLGSISRCKSSNTPPAAELQAAYHLYQQKLQQLRACDFDDILLMALALPDAATAGFRHLLVDEFQDSNAVQYQLVQKWATSCSSLFVIGDPDQSIYAFRGADGNCFRRIQQDYPQLEQVCLQQNFRSTPQILAAALPVINQSSGAARELVSQLPEGSLVQHLQADATFGEALFICKEITRLLGGVDMLQAHSGKGRQQQGLSFSDFAVIFRTRKQAEVMQHCLQTEGIPYVLAGRDDFAADSAVQSSLAFFRLLLQPENLAALRRALLFCGTPPESAAQIIHSYSAGKLNLAALKKCCQRQADAAAFSALLDKYASTVRRQKPCVIVESWIADNVLQSNPAMEKLLLTALRYSDFALFIRAMLFGEEGDIEQSGSRVLQQEAVRLTTIHASKGLEFPVVFLAGLRDGLLPLKTTFAAADIEEERRLLFVAMTRAKELLYLLTAEPPSPFFSAIPKHVLSEAADAAKPRLRGKQLALFD